MMMLIILSLRSYLYRISSFWQMFFSAKMKILPSKTSISRIRVRVRMRAIVQITVKVRVVVAHLHRVGHVHSEEAENGDGGRP